MSFLAEFGGNVLVATGVAVAAGVAFTGVWFMVVLSDHLQIQGRNYAAAAAIVVPVILGAALVMTLGGAT